MFRQALNEIIRRLEQAKAGGLLQEFALVGGLAVSAWGVPRPTRDIDFVLALGSAAPTLLAIHLEGSYQAAYPDDYRRGLIKTGVTVEGQTVPVRIFLLPPNWTKLIFRRVQTLSILECSVPVLSWHSLILLKLYTGGPQDILDAQELLSVRRPTHDELSEMALEAEALGLADAFKGLREKRRTL